MNVVARESAPHADPVPAFTADPPVSGMPVGRSANNDRIPGDVPVVRLNDLMVQAIAICGAALIMLIAIEGFRLIAQAG